MLSPVAGLGAPSPLMAVPAWICIRRQDKDVVDEEVALHILKVSNGFYHQIQLGVASLNITVANLSSHRRLEKRLDESK